MRPLIATPLALLTTIVIMLTLTTPGVARDIGIALTVLGVVALTYGWLLVRRYLRLNPVITDSRTRQPEGSDTTS